MEKTKEIVVDFRRVHSLHAPLTINGATVERVSSTKFLGVHITEGLSWTNNTAALAKKSQQRLLFIYFTGLHSIYHVPYATLSIYYYCYYYFYFFLHVLICIFVITAFCVCMYVCMYIYVYTNPIPKKLGHCTNCE